MIIHKIAIYFLDVQKYKTDSLAAVLETCVQNKGSLVDPPRIELGLKKQIWKGRSQWQPIPHS